MWKFIKKKKENNLSNLSGHQSYLYWGEQDVIEMLHVIDFPYLNLFNKTFEKINDDKYVLVSHMIWMYWIFNLECLKAGKNIYLSHVNFCSILMTILIAYLYFLHQWFRIQNWMKFQSKKKKKKNLFILMQLNAIWNTFSYFMNLSVNSSNMKSYHIR